MSTVIQYPTHSPSRRRAATMVLVVVTLPVLLGAAALTVDVAVLVNTRADLQNAADAAAMAGASALALDAMVSVRESKNRGHIQTVEKAVSRRVHSIAYLNHSLGTDGLKVDESDITLGWIDVSSATSPIQPDAVPNTFNAVQVVVRRDTQSANGPVRLFFAPIFGRMFSNVSASAVAVYDDRFSGLETDEAGAIVWPFTLHIDEYNRQVLTGDDLLAWDPVDETVTSDPDGVGEIILFPDRAAPGDYGLLNIGLGSTGVTGLTVHIEDGVPPEDVEAEIGTTKLSFFDEYGEPMSYKISGTPGIKSSLESSINLRVGHVVAFFVHENVGLGGSNAIFQVVGLRFGRVMKVNLRDSSKARGVFLQVVSYCGQGVDTNPEVPSSYGVAGRIALVR